MNILCYIKLIRLYYLEMQFHVQVTKENNKSGWKMKTTMAPFGLFLSFFIYFSLPNLIDNNAFKDNFVKQIFN